MASGRAVEVDHRDDLDYLTLVSEEYRSDGGPNFFFTAGDFGYEVDLELVDNMPHTSRIKRTSLDGGPARITSPEYQVEG